MSLFGVSDNRETPRSLQLHHRVGDLESALSRLIADCKVAAARKSAAGLAEAAQSAEAVLRSEP